MSTAPAQSTLDVDPDGTRLAARRTAALERLRAARGTWHQADLLVAKINADRAPAPRPRFFRDRTGPRPVPMIVWARPGRHDTVQETALGTVFRHHFNGTHVYYTPEDPEEYSGVRAEHLATYEGGSTD